MNGKLTRALGSHSSGLSLIRCLSQSLIKAAACERPVKPNIVSLSIWLLVSDSNRLRARVARSPQAILVAILLIPGWRTPRGWRCSTQTEYGHRVRYIDTECDDRREVGMGGRTYHVCSICTMLSSDGICSTSRQCLGVAVVRCLASVSSDACRVGEARTS